jgi:DNA-binding transcriptional MerR regulator
MDKKVFKQHPGFAYSQPQSSEARFDTPDARQSVVRKESAKDAPRKADGAFRTISEVADELEVQQHVLRFWETKFTQVKPLKRGGGRRYYRPEDVALLKHIHHLLYTEGYTIKGVQKLLKGQGKQQIVARAENENAPVVSQPKVAAVAAPAPHVVAEGRVEFAAKPVKMTDTERTVLEVMLEELKALRSMVDAA